MDCMNLSQPANLTIKQVRWIPEPRAKRSLESTVGQNREKQRKNSHLIIHGPTSEGGSKVSKRFSAAERASKVSSAEQAND